ncbi:MAG: site-specific integrase [Chloroflexi bacterium]|nr:site-specific integrase [Chloroflexota bacterium]
MAKQRGRRGHGEGSIHQREDGRWVAVVDQGWKDGKRQRKYLYGETRREVSEKLKAALHDQAAGLPLPSERQTVGQFLERWLEDSAKPNVRPRTFTRYHDLLTLHAIPTLGKRPLAKLSAQDLQALYGQKLDQLAARTVGHLHRVLHCALRDALRWGLVARNVCDAVQPPKVARPEMQVLAPEQARQLLAAADGEPLEALYVLAVTAGLRQGELFGLKWQDLDLEAGRLQVRRTLGRVRKQGFLESEPKSARSRRSITLTPLAIGALRHHRARQLEQRLAVGSAWEDRGLVFCNAVGRPLEPSNLLRRSWRPLLKKAGLPRIRFHDLRHTAATLLLAQGVHPKIVQEMLGHSTISLTLDTYSHLLPNLQDEAAAKMQAILVRLK